jgi:hypothetical protein
MNDVHGLVISERRTVQHLITIFIIII